MSNLNVNTSTIPKLTERNYTEWLVNTRAHLRRSKLWKYTQEDVPEEAKNKDKWEEAADLMTPTLSAEIKRKLTEEDFNNGYKMSRRSSRPGDKSSITITSCFSSSPIPLHPKNHNLATHITTLPTFPPLCLHKSLAAKVRLILRSTSILPTLRTSTSTLARSARKIRTTRKTSTGWTSPIVVARD